MQNVANYDCKIAESMNWNDLRYLLEVSRHGALAPAASALRVDQTTVARRLKALERDTGSKLLDRIGGRYVPTAAGEAALAQARAVEEATTNLLTQVGNQDASLSGTVRVTAVHELLAGYLVPRLAPFRARHPDIVVEFVGESSNLSLSRREADIAIRLARPEGGHLFVRKVAVMGFAVYGARGADKAWRNCSPHHWGTYDWVTYDDSLAHLPEARWVAQHVDGQRVVLRSNGLRVLTAAIDHGLAVGLLPCFIGDPDPRLTRLSGSEPLVQREVWLLVHPELRHSARVRVVIDWLVEFWNTERQAFAGEAAATT